MWSLFVSVAAAAPDDDLRQEIATIRDRVMLPILVGVRDERASSALRGLDVVTVHLGDDDPASLERILLGRGMRCGVQVQAEGDRWTTRPVGRCGEAAIPAAPVAPEPPDVPPRYVPPRRIWDVSRPSWAFARGARLGGLTTAAVGFGFSGLGLWGLSGCTAQELGCLVWAIPILGGAAIGVTGLAALTVGHVVEDHVLRGIVRRRWPGQVGAVALGAGLASVALWFTPLAWDDYLLPVGITAGLLGCGLVLEAAQLVSDQAWYDVDAALVTLSVNPRGASLMLRW